MKNLNPKVGQYVRVKKWLNKYPQHYFVVTNVDGSRYTIKSMKSDTPWTHSLYKNQPLYADAWELCHQSQYRLQRLNTVYGKIQNRPIRKIKTMY